MCLIFKQTNKKPLAILVVHAYIPIWDYKLKQEDEMFKTNWGV